MSSDRCIDMQTVQELKKHVDAFLIGLVDANRHLALSSKEEDPILKQAYRILQERHLASARTAWDELQTVGHSILKNYDPQ